MFISLNNHSPQVHDSAWVAPDATICGNVTIGPSARVLYGARIIAEGGAIDIGAHTIIMENAVVRSTSRHSTRISAHCLVGPCAHLVGCTIEEEVFIC